MDLWIAAWEPKLRDWKIRKNCGLLDNRLGSKTSKPESRGRLKNSKVQLFANFIAVLSLFTSKRNVSRWHGVPARVVVRMPKWRRENICRGMAPARVVVVGTIRSQARCYWFTKDHTTFL